MFDSEVWGGVAKGSDALLLLVVCWSCTADRNPNGLSRRCLALVCVLGAGAAAALRIHFLQSGFPLSVARAV